MTLKSKNHHSLEILEARIAPANVYASILEAEWVNASAGTSGDTGSSTFELKAGQGLKSGSQFLLFIEQGNAIVFATDIDNDSVIDYHEITGIAAGDGLRMISFVDIHGDIATNLIETRNGSETVLTLTDSDNNPNNDLEANGKYRGDGRVILNKTIDKIELRSLTVDDLNDENGNGTKTDELEQHKAFSTYSIYGNIYAGRGFGAEDGGLIVDSSEAITPVFDNDTNPSIGSIKVGTAVSGEFFSFGVSRRNDWHGVLSTFTAPNGQAGGSITGLKTIGTTTFNLNGLIAGDGGVGAAGGNIVNIALSSDDSGGYYIIAGKGGSGLSGGNGGSILNFSDTGSATGKVIVKTGDGGVGSTGSGGNSGNLEVGNWTLRGNIVIELGDGGDGFRSGGNGASLLVGTISTPDDTKAEGANATGVTHYPSGANPVYTPVVGSHAGIDFNNDGFGDWVTTTVNPSQVMVSLGNGLGGFMEVLNQYGELSDYAYFLSGVRNPDAMVVADLNADGHPDIAVGSSDYGQQAGIVVYLSKYEDLDESGTLTGNEDLNKNGINDFIGFHDGRFSPLAGYLNSAGLFGNIVQINDLGAGDFDGNGVVEIVVQGVFLADGTTENNTTIGQVLAFAQPDSENGRYTGQFFLDHGSKGSVSPPVAADPLSPIRLISFGAGTGVQGDGSQWINMQVTALTNDPLNTTYDSVIVGYQETSDAGGGIDVYRYFNRSGGLFGVAPQYVGSFTMGKVDIDRELDPNHTNLVDFVLHDYTIMDFDGDGMADIAAVSKTPVGFMIGIKGDGSGMGLPDTGTGDQAGNKEWDDRDLLGITSGNYNGGAGADDFAVIYPLDAINADGFDYYQYVSGPAAITLIRAWDTSFYDSNYDLENPSIPFSNFMVDVFDPTTSDAGVGMEDGTGIGFPILEITSFPTSYISYPADSLTFKAGDGGNSLTGQGGIGGGLGKSIKIATITTVIDDGDGDATNDVTVTEKVLQGDLKFIMNIPMDLIAGNGGNGFSKGGKGGSITGISTETTSRVTLTGGDGGRGVAGAGGAGGDLISNSIVNGVIFTAGAGGVGRTGGAGGDVIGVNITSYSDTYTANSVVVTAGAGGYGTRGGGAGGSIANFLPSIVESVSLAPRLTYVGGAGGNAVSGAGGKGGSVTNSSPIDANGIDGDIFIEAGRGGGGTSGGAGGSVLNFTHNPSSTTQFANIISVLAGDGGVGSSGIGGLGGEVRGIAIPTNGSFAPTLEPYNFNRIMGGNGGASSASKGGNGGAVTDIYITSGELSTAVVAGAGGHGLTAGGKGGSASTIRLEPGASTESQGLVIGGAGGSAAAFIANPNDFTARQGRNAFGGVVGVGGEGGSILNVFQPGGSSQSHINLISGNGGDTLHYGTISDPKVYVGKGGSIKNVDLIMDIGNVTGDDPNTLANESVLIKSYNNILAGETLAEWVVSKMRPAISPVPFVDLNDSDGNVGIIVGAAGRNKPALIDGVFNTTPSNNAQNGDLVNIRAKNLLSAVAGSVDRIAAINVVRGLNIAPGVVGAEKGEFSGTDPDYLAADGVTPLSEPVLDGILFDGAVVAHDFFDLSGNPVTIQGKVFKL